MNHSAAVPCVCVCHVLGHYNTVILNCMRISSINARTMRAYTRYAIHLAFIYTKVLCMTQSLSLSLFARSSSRFVSKLWSSNCKNAHQMILCIRNLWDWFQFKILFSFFFFFWLLQKAIKIYDKMANCVAVGYFSVVLML